MPALPIWLERLAPPGPSLNSRSVSSFEASANSILQARREAYDLVVRSLAQRTNKPVNGWQPGADSKPPGSFNNKGIQALFALLGAAMVLASIWFFFFAKNGGFHFEDGDWEDYKSTVLRRKGPDGRTLTNATKSTKLGGSTIVGTQHFKWAKQTAKSVVSYDEKGRKGILAKRGWGKTHSIMYGDDFTDYGDGRTRYQDVRSRADEMTEVRTIRMPSHHRSHSKHRRDRDVQDYKKEKPARVGGLNRVPDGSHIDTTNTDVSDVYSENSERPILNKKNRDREHDKDRAERRARAEAGKMERRWKREAEEAAAALAQESARSLPTPKKSVSPSKPCGTKQRSSSRSTSPKKRDFSYQSGPESEMLSTAQTGTPSRRTTSYYDEYRPRAGDSRGYESDYTSRSRQNSPTKKTPARGGRDGGY